MFLDRSTLKSAFFALILSTVYCVSWYYNGQLIPLLAISIILLLISINISAIPLFTKGLPWPKAFLPTFMVAWFAWYGLTLFWSTVPYSSWFYFWELGSLPLSFIAWVLIPSELKEKAWGYLWAGIMLTAWVLIGIDLWQYLGEFIFRPTGPLMDINSFAAWMNLILFPTMIVYIIHESKRDVPFMSSKINIKSLFYLITITALLMSFFSTASRGGFLSWLCTIPITVWFLRKQHNGVKSLALIGVLSVISILFMQYVHHYDLFFELQPHFIMHNMATVSRGLMWLATWNMYLAHPWLGTGLGSYFLYYPEYRMPLELASAGTYAHNDYLQFLAEGGPINLGFLLIFATSLFYGLYTIAKKLKSSVVAEDQDALFYALGLLLGVFAITGHALGNFIFYNLPLSILAGLFMGRAWQLYGNKESTQPLLHKIGISHVVIPRVIIGLATFFGALYLTIDSASYVLFNNPQWLRPVIKPTPQFLLKSAAVIGNIRPLATAPHIYMANLYSNLANNDALSKKDRLLFIHSALRQYKASLYGIPQQSGVYSEIGTCFLKHGKILGLDTNAKTKKALYYWTKGLAINPENVTLRYNIAVVKYAHNGHILKAVQFMDAGLGRPLFPYQREKLRFYVSVIQFNAGLYTESQDTLLQLLHSHPSYQPAIIVLRHMLKTKGE